MTLHAIIPAAGLGRRLGDEAGGAPKSLLRIGGHTPLERTVAQLAARGVSRLTVVVGYGADRIRACLAAIDPTVAVDFACNADYAVTEHGYSLHCARAAWQRTRLPVLLLDADNVLDPALLDRLLAAPAADCVMTDATLDTAGRDEELVLGEAGRVTGFVRGRAREFEHCVGAFVGVNRFSAAFMERLFAFMEDLFAREGRGFKYERVLHRLLAEPGTAAVSYLDTAGLGWVNVNHPEDVPRAAALIRATRQR